MLLANYGYASVFSKLIAVPRSGVSRDLQIRTPRHGVDRGSWQLFLSMGTHFWVYTHVVLFDALTL